MLVKIQQVHGWRRLPRSLPHQSSAGRRRRRRRVNLIKCRLSCTLARRWTSIVHAERAANLNFQSNECDDGRVWPAAALSLSVDEPSGWCPFRRQPVCCGQSTCFAMSSCDNIDSTNGTWQIGRKPAPEVAQLASSRPEVITFSKADKSSFLAETNRLDN